MSTTGQANRSSKAASKKPPVRIAKAEKPQRDALSLKSGSTDERRAGRLSRRAETEDAPRAYKSGKSFEVDRKPRAHGDEPARVRGDRPQRGTPKGSRIQDGSPMSAPAARGRQGRPGTEGWRRSQRAGQAEGTRCGSSQVSIVAPRWQRRPPAASPFVRPAARERLQHSRARLRRRVRGRPCHGRVRRHRRARFSRR